MDKSRKGKPLAIRFHDPKKTFHHKSRSGCRTCKARRVKCDERRPICKNCDRCDRPCIYDPFHFHTPKSQRREPKSTKNAGLGAHRVGLDCDPCSDITLLSSVNGIVSKQIPESKHRRLFELQLLHVWMNYLYNPFNVPKAASDLWWSSDIPRLALQFDNLQYLLFASSASYLARHRPDDLEAIRAQRTYMGLALQAQRKAVANLSIENSAAVCFSALLLLVRTFTDLRGRPLDPYRPPTEWLRMGRGTGAVLIAVRTLIANHKQPSQPPTNPGEVVGVPPIFKWRNLVTRENRIPFSHLLSTCDELEDAETIGAYESALSILGSIHNAIANAEPPYALARRLVSFPMYVPTKFVDLVDEQRPRALVILAHYFFLLQRQEFLWWINNIPRREIQAIQRVLSPEWQDLIREPVVAAARTPL